MKGNWICCLLFPLAIVSGLASDLPSVVVSSSSNGTAQVSLYAKRGYHYFLYRSRDLRSVGEPIDAVLGDDAQVVLRDRYRPLLSRAFYRVKEVANQASGDVDKDGIADVDELAPSVGNEGRSSGNVWVPTLDVEPSDGLTTLAYEDFEALSVDFDSASGVGAGMTGERIIKFLVFPFHEPSPTIVFRLSVRFAG